MPFKYMRNKYVIMIHFNFSNNVYIIIDAFGHSRQPWKNKFQNLIISNLKSRKNAIFKIMFYFVKVIIICLRKHSKLTGLWMQIKWILKIFCINTQFTTACKFTSINVILIYIHSAISDRQKYFDP